MRCRGPAGTTPAGSPISPAGRGPVGADDPRRTRVCPAGRVPLAGLLLAIPALEATGLLPCAATVFGCLRNGFYGLDTMLLEGVLRALAGQPRAEGSTRVDPVALGRVLGLDRGPEVKTIRRKITDLAATGRADELLAAMAATHVARLEASNPDLLAVFYVDGHVRAYQGGRKVAKTHLSRLKFPAPATVETWISDASGDPVLVVMAAPGASLAMELRRVLPDLRRASATTGGSWSGSTAAAGHQPSSSTWMPRVLTC